MKRINDNTYELITGRHITVACGVLGIDSALIAFDGFDGYLLEFDSKPLTQIERFDIASSMAQGWYQWALK